MVTSILLLTASLVLLAVGAEALVRGASALAKRMGVSAFFIGLTIVGFGTSTPELITSIVAGLEGRTDIAVGNVVGSNIFNIAAILGLTALIAPIPVRTQVVRGEVFIVILTALLPFSAMAFGGTLPGWIGLVMMGLLVLYVVRGFRAGRASETLSPQATKEAARELERELGLAKPGWRQSLTAHLLSIAVGLALLVLGSNLLVDAASRIARALGVSELAIGLTIVAAGTSAPELVTSLVAALRKQSDIAVGNILGSNVFNILGVLGATTALTPQRLAPQVLRLDGPVMVAASLALLPIALYRNRISRLEGALLLSAYVAYVVVLFTLAPGWFAV